MFRKWSIDYEEYSGGSTGGDRGTRAPPLFLDQNEARRAEKKFFEAAAPPTPPLPPPSLQTLSTSSFSSINVTYLYRVFQNRQKISKGLNTSLVVSIVRTATSVTKMISRKYKLNSTYLKERCWFLAQPSEINLFLTRSRVVMFWRSFGSMKTALPFSQHRNNVNNRRRNIR